MADLIRFVSKSDLDEKKAERREEREAVLRQAKEMYDKREQKLEEKRRKGEDTWMLPSVDKRLSPGSSDDDESSKKHKRGKKKKKKRKKRHKSSSEEDEWVPKDSLENQANSAGNESLPQVQSYISWLQDSSFIVSRLTQPSIYPLPRDSWMLFPLPSEAKSKGMPARVSVTTSEAENKHADSSLSTSLELGQHPRELNPYWKKGGAGLPSQKTTVKVENSGGNRAWFKRAYERAKQQAEDEGRSLEEVAAERWGSLEKLKSLANGDDGNRRSNSKESSNTQRDWKKYENDHRGKACERNSESSRDRKSHMGDGMFRKPVDNQGSSLMLLMRPPDDSDHGHASSLKSRHKTFGQYQQQKTTPASGRWRKKGREEDTERATSPVTPVSQAMETRDAEIETSSKQSSSGSESSDGSDSKRESVEGMKSQRVTEADLNALGAKRLKAELMGNEELAKELDIKLEKLRNVKDKQEQTSLTKKTKENDDDNNVVVLTRTDRAGNCVPVSESRSSNERKGKRRNRHKMVATHDKDGKRSRYFCDDDDHDLNSLVSQERSSTAEDSNATYARLAHKLGGKFDLDDMFESAAASKYTPEELEEKARQKAIREHQKLAAQMDNCKSCLDNPHLAKHLIIAIGIKVYLTLPASQSLTDGHCLIIPIMHHTAGTMVDEDIWSEIQIFKKGLTKMFEEMGKDVIFMEINRNLHKKEHMVIECVPVDKEVADMAPMYFKKAIQESDSEWAQNKKLIDTRKKSLRLSVPKGLPYFAVEFGLDGGFAHVIENEDLIPHYFGKIFSSQTRKGSPHVFMHVNPIYHSPIKKEIIGGMLELEPFIWTKPRKENFQTQKKKVLQFADWWKPFDWTQKIQKK